jgi:hypothetical protein
MHLRINSLIIVFMASKPWKQPLGIAANHVFYCRKRDELVFPPPPSCPKPPTTPIILPFDAF